VDRDPEERDRGPEQERGKGKEVCEGMSHGAL